MLVITDRGLGNTVVVQKLAGVARILAGDEIGFAKHAQGAQSDVLQIADRSRYQVKSASHRSTMKRYPKWTRGHKARPATTSGRQKGSRPRFIFIWKWWTAWDPRSCADSERFPSAAPKWVECCSGPSSRPKTRLSCALRISRRWLATI